MKKRILKLVFFFLEIILFILIYVFLYKQYGFTIPCIFHKITGYYCPGCGVTRMLVSLAKGNIIQAFMYNQFLFIMLPFFILYLFYSIYLYITDKKDKILKRIPKCMQYILLSITILWGIIRNLSIFPYLRP